MAFEWKVENEKPLLEFSNDHMEWQVEAIPTTIQTPPPDISQPIQVIDFKVVEDNVEIRDVLIPDIFISENEKITEIQLDRPPEIETAPEILDFTETQAQFKGGMEAWYDYLRMSLTYQKKRKNWASKERYCCAL